MTGTTIGTIGYFLFVIFASILTVCWIIMPIIIFSIRKRLDKIIELLSQPAK